MKRNFLILMLLSLLPLAGWAADGDITEPTPKTGESALTYSSSAQELLATPGSVAGTGYELRYAVVTDATATPDWDDFSTAAPKGTAAGDYYVFFASYNTATQEHSAIGPKISVNIAKATLTNSNYDAPVGATSLTYKGKNQSQQLIATAAKWKTDGEGHDIVLGTFQYKLGAEGTWTEDATTITAINANTTGYEVFYRIVGDANHKTLESESQKITVTVAAKNLPTFGTEGAYSFTATNPTYNGSILTGNKLPQFSATDGSDNLTSDDYTVEWYKGSIANENLVANIKDAGTYLLQIKGKGNYASTSVVNSAETWKFTVKQKAIIIYVEDKSKTYDGQAITTTAASGVTPFHINDVTIVAPGLVDTELKADLYAKFETDSYNSSVPKDYKEGGYAMIAFTKTPTLWTNYDLDDTSFGAYTINKRNVTVTVRDQGDFTYTGSAIATDNSSGTRPDAKIWLKPVVYDATTSPVTDGTITIEAAGETSGLISGDNIVSDLTLSLTSDVIAVGTASGAYANYITVSGTPTNYNVIPANGGVTVVGKPMKVMANSFINGVYGNKLSDFTFAYRTNPANLTLKNGIEYKVYDKDENEVTDANAILDAGTYTIKITENADLAPDNYTITTFMEGEIVIAKKELNITIDDVALNSGDGQTELTKYASINSSYKTNLVTNQDIDVAIIFDASKTDLLTSSKLKTAEDYTSADPALSYWTAATSTLAGVTVLDFDEDDDANKNYNILFTPGNIILGGAKTLKLDITSAQLADKIADAAAACTADENVKYNVAFGAKTMKANEWYAMVLPFATSAYELVTQLGQYVVVNTYGDDSTPNNISFHVAMGDIAAGVPFLIKAGTALNWNGKNFTGKPIVAAPVAQGDLATKGSVFTGVFSTGNVLLNGYELDGTTADATLAYRWLSDSDVTGFNRTGNAWRDASADDHHKRALSALEAYLQVPAGSNARITVEDFDGQTTSIQVLNAGEINVVTADGWYTLNGVKLQSTPTQKGIYINNGKKVVVK